MTTLEFSAMVQKYQSLVYTVCHQLVPDAGDAQDLTQETFLAAWRAIDRCPSGFEKQWLARIAANKAKDYLRSAWVRRVNIPGDDVLALEGAPPGAQPEQQVLDALGEEELTAMILDLREPYRTPCRLVLLEQHTMAEAAQLCGRPPKTVEAQITGQKRCWHSRYYSVKTMERSAYMELFDKNGCLTDEGLQALQAGGLDELGRLETAEHLSYCDKCMDRYTALLTADALETPPHSAHKAVMAAIWVRLMQNTWGRAAVAGVAAVLAFTMWRSGTIDQLLNFRQELHTWTPETSQSQTEEALQLGKPVEDGRPSAQPEILGKPMDDDKPKQQASLAKALNDLLFGAGGPAAEKYKNSPLAHQTK